MKKKFYLKGYAVVFGTCDSHTDIILRGAISDKESLHNGEIPLLLEHNTAFQIGFVQCIKSDMHGVFISAVLDMGFLPLDSDIPMLIESGYIRGFSIGYRATSSFFDDSKLIRYISRLNLHEISVVSVPSNSYTVIDDFGTI
jgi:HK97 family phage prohead protease